MCRQMLSLSFQFTSGDSQVVEVAHLSNGPSGSVLFFGFIDTEKFIDSIVLSNSQRKDVSPQSSVLLCLDEREAGSRTVRWLIRVPSPSPQVYVIQSWPWLRSAQGLYRSCPQPLLVLADRAVRSDRVQEDLWHHQAALVHAAGSCRALPRTRRRHSRLAAAHAGQAQDIGRFSQPRGRGS